jgi:hypothetical protein
LAAALGNDANFATTVSTNLGQKLGATASVTLTGDVTGTASFSSNAVSIATTVADDSHNHVISNVDGLQTALDAKLPSSGGTLDAYKETSVSATVGTTTYTVNCNTTNTFKLTMTGNPTIAFSNVPTSGTVFSLTLVLVHSGGSRTVTFPASVKWQGGTAPTLSASGDTDIITLFTMDGGTNWYASTAGLDFS